MKTRKIINAILEFASLYWKPISRNLWFFIFSFALLFSAEKLMSIGVEQRYLYPQLAHEMLFDLYILCFFIAFLPRKARHIAHIILFAFLASCTIADMFCDLKFKSHITPTMIMLMLETDTREAGEFFSTYLTRDVWQSNIIWPILISASYFLLRIPVLIPRRCKEWFLKRQNLKTLKDKCAGIQNFFHKLGDILAKPYITAPAGLLCLAAAIYCFNEAKPNKEQTVALFSMDNIGDVEHHLTKATHARMYCSPYRLLFSINSNRLTAKQMTTLHETIANTKIDSCSFRSPNIVLIIGEAYNKHHSQLYGYERPTTPEQVRMKKSGLLTPFTDVVSPWNLTSYVFKHIMTTYTVGDKGEWCNYPLICNIFRRAGYYVTFLTNEFMSKPTEQVFDFSGGFFMNDPELSKEQFNARNTRLHAFDISLLNDYKSLEDKRIENGTGDKGRLTIFHLMGQHNNYSQRCPKNKKVFKRSEYENRPELKNDVWRQDVCDYDNATHYNDYVVSEIVKRFEQDDAIIIYMPDHGEDVRSPERPYLMGRLHSTTIDKLLAREEFEIPFWIWCSKKYAATRPDIASQIRKSASQPYMTDALPHLLMYLAGIECQYYHPELNILSPEYDATRTRLLKHQVDYDKLMGNK